MLMNQLFGGTFPKKGFPQGPLQRLFIVCKTPGNGLGSCRQIEFFGESLRESFFSKKVLSNIYSLNIMELA